MTHVRSPESKRDAMLGIGERTIEKLSVASDVTPLARLAIGLSRSGEFAELLAGGRVKTVTAFFVVNIDVAGRDTEVAASVHWRYGLMSETTDAETIVPATMAAGVAMVSNKWSTQGM